MKNLIRIVLIMVMGSGVSYGLVIDGVSLMPGSEVTTSALEVAQAAMEIIAENVANQFTTKDVDGGRYRAKEVNFEGLVIEESDGGTSLGVKIGSISRSNAPGVRTFNPQHPHADAEGYIEASNVNVSEEMMKMMKYSRWIEAEYVVANASAKIVQNALALGQ